MYFKDKTYYANKVKYYAGLTLSALAFSLIVIMAVVLA